MKFRSVAPALLAITAATSAFAGEGAAPSGIPALDHVFVIMMENHAYGQIVANPQAPFINSLMQNANVATNYFAIAHPSSTNYLEVVGGSNFNNLSDQYPNWHSSACAPNIKSGITNTDNPSTGRVCPIVGTGQDAAVPVVDTTQNETSAPPLTNINGAASIPAENVVGKSIADQLVRAGKRWKSYQEGLPIQGADGVDVSDGFYISGTNNAEGNPVSTDFTKLSGPPLGTNVQGDNSFDSSGLVFLYAVKHNPFAYFASIQEGKNPELSLNRVASFEGEKGLYADLKEGHVPDFAFIAPNQCNDMHGRGNATPYCNFDADDNGTQAGLNPALIMQGDLEVQRIVTSIKASSVWEKSRSAIVILWDENDYSTTTSNQVLLIVDQNYLQSPQHVVSNSFYTHYSLTKTLDAAFGLPCLNHACDAGVNVMADLFK